MAGMGMYAGAPSSAAAETKKMIKTLTRTDFLIQFVWKPELTEPLPEDPEQRKAKIDEQAAKVRELVEKIKEFENQKSNSAVTIPSADEEIEIAKASKQKTSELEAAIQKALLTIASPAPEGAAGGVGAPATGGAGDAPGSTSVTPGAPAAAPPPR